MKVGASPDGTAPAGTMPTPAPARTYVTTLSKRVTTSACRMCRPAAAAAPSIRRRVNESTGSDTSRSRDTSANRMLSGRFAASACAAGTTT